jgi:hypothetical protein
VIYPSIFYFNPQAFEHKCEKIDFSKKKKLTKQPTNKIEEGNRDSICRTIIFENVFLGILTKKLRDVKA